MKRFSLVPIFVLGIVLLLGTLVYQAESQWTGQTVTINVNDVTKLTATAFDDSMKAVWRTAIRPDSVEGASLTIDKAWTFDTNLTVGTAGGDDDSLTVYGTIMVGDGTDGAQVVDMLDTTKKMIFNSTGTDTQWAGDIPIPAGVTKRVWYLPGISQTTSKFMISFKRGGMEEGLGGDSTQYRWDVVADSLRIIASGTVVTADTAVYFRFEIQ